MLSYKMIVPRSNTIKKIYLIFSNSRIFLSTSFCVLGSHVLYLFLFSLCVCWSLFFLLLFWFHCFHESSYQLRLQTLRTQCPTFQLTSQVNYLQTQEYIYNDTVVLCHLKWRKYWERTKIRIGSCHQVQVVQVHFDR